MIVDKGCSSFYRELIISIDAEFAWYYKVMEAEERSFVIALDRTRNSKAMCAKSGAVQ